MMQILVISLLSRVEKGSTSLSILEEDEASESCNLEVRLHIL